MSISIPLANIDIATASAAIIIVDNAAKISGDFKASPSTIREAIPPIYGLTWNRTVCSHFEGGRLNAVLAKVRNSALPREEYERLASFWKQAISVVSQYLPEWEEWRVLFERFRLERRYGQRKLCDVITFLLTKSIDSPELLGSLAFSEIEKYAMGLL